MDYCPMEQNPPGFFFFFSNPIFLLPHSLLIKSIQTFIIGHDEIGRALIKVLENCPNLRALSARGFGSKVLLYSLFCLSLLFLPLLFILFPTPPPTLKILIPVLHSLNRCPSLQELRISDNDLRDGGASVLAHCLRDNTTLRFGNISKRMICLEIIIFLINIFNHSHHSGS